MKIIALLLIVLATQARAVLVYEVSAPVGGQGQLGITDFGGDQLGRTEGYIPVLFGNLQFTIYFDPIAGTLRQVGYVPLLIEDHDFVMTDRGRTVPGTLTISQSFATDRYHLDTGELPLIFDSPTHAHLGSLTGPFSYGQFGSLPRVNGNWSLLTDGETFTGNFSYQLEWGMFFPFQDIEFSDADQSSIVLDGMQTGSPFGSPKTTVLRRSGPIEGDKSFTAPNGFNVFLTTGFGDFTDYFTWSAGPATATIVPEGGPGLWISAFVFAALLSFFRPRKENA